jgi:hypothetical protein
MIQPDGSVLWHALYQGVLAIRITEKGNTQTMALRNDNAWHEIVDNGDPKIGYIISPLLSEMKQRAPFIEPNAKEGLIGCRTYREILDDLSEEYLKLRKYPKPEAREMAKRLNWTHYKGYLPELIKGVSKIDPVRTQGNKHTYGMSYEHLYIRIIEEKGRPAILKWNDDAIVCQDPRLKEVANEVLNAFKARCLSMSKENQDAFHNFISGYIQVSTAISRAAANDQEAANTQPQPVGERRIGERRMGERRVGDRRVINLTNWQVISENGGS